MKHKTDRLALCIPVVRPGDPAFNADRMLEQIADAEKRGATFIFFPIFSIPGATCGSLLQNKDLQASSRKAADRVLSVVRHGKAIVVFSSIDEKGNVSRLVNFVAGKGFVRTTENVFFEEDPIPDSINFMVSDERPTLNFHSISASTTVFERLHIERTIRDANDIDVILTPGVHESSADGVRSGRAMISVGGAIVACNAPFSRTSTMLVWDVPEPGVRPFVRPDPLLKAFDDWIDDRAHTSPLPYLPDDPALQDEVVRTASLIQAHGLATRLERTHAARMVLGVSGGLDSTAALLACARAADLLDRPRSSILAVTMPGFGTTGRTKDNALALASALGAEVRTIPIGDAVLQHFKDIGHNPEKKDVVYENAQARMRTMILMDLANAENGLVIGTGDLSEAALGWCTYNGDQMAMYNINIGLPKTFLRALVAHEADHAPDGLARILRDVLDTPVSPELLPGSQKTEDILGSYELHDFFLWHFLSGMTMVETRGKAIAAFGADRTAEIDRTLETFRKRILASEFKRKAAPDGPRVFTEGFHPDTWRVPSDLSNAFLTTSAVPHQER